MSDIYDHMDDGARRRERNRARIAELEADGEARRQRIAEALALLTAETDAETGAVSAP